jgi:hypothetical protein
VGIIRLFTAWDGDSTVETVLHRDHSTGMDGLLRVSPQRNRSIPSRRSHRPIAVGLLAGISDVMRHRSFGLGSDCVPDEYVLKVSRALNFGCSIPFAVSMRDMEICHHQA